MDKRKKEQIKTLRAAGYSYQQIADMFGMNRSTVSNYCLRNHIDSPNEVAKPASITTHYGLCPNCQELFVLTNKKNKRFCSTKCRMEYWRSQKDKEGASSHCDETHMTHEKGLDFSPKKSDELDGREIISYRITIEPCYDKRE